MIGSKVLHYKILEKLGEGGMGVVYKAEDSKLDRLVAIKFLPDHISLNIEEKERFIIEAKAAAALNHPNITTIYSIEEVDNEYFIVMEYIDGIELKDKIQSNGLSVNNVLILAPQIAEALNAAHKKGIIHRDIKSQNIMINSIGNVKIMDFGLARMGNSSQLTKDHSITGTVAYMSPEQAKGENADNRTDIFSFGIVLYEMLTGTVPFKGDYEQAVLYSLLNEEADLEELHKKSVPVPLINLIEKCLRKNRNERYNSFEEIINEINKIPISGSQNIDVENEIDENNNLLKSFKPQDVNTFSGRDEQIKLLCSKIEECKKGFGSTVIISGEPGIGKTQLISKVINLYDPDLITFLYGRCVFNNEGGVPYQPFVSSVKNNLVKTNEYFISTLLRLSEKHNLNISSRLSLIKSFLNFSGDFSKSIMHKDQLWEAVLSLFTLVAVEKPLVLILDDLQWCDKTSLGLFTFLVRNIKNLPIMIIGMHRSLQISDENSDLIDIIRQLRIEDMVVKIDLTRLNKNDSQNIIVKLLEENSVNKKIVDEIYKQSEGNPLFIYEFTRLLRERKTIELNDKGEWVYNKDFSENAVSDKIQDVIKQRVDRLDNESKEILQFASCQGEYFQSAVLIECLKLDKIRLLKLLQRLENDNNIINYENKNYKFDHILIRDILYESIIPELREEYHNMIAQWLINNYKNKVEYASSVAHHLLASDNEKDAVSYLLTAAIRAKELYAAEEAISFYNKLEKINQKFGVDQNSKILIKEGLGDINLFSGNPDKALEYFIELLELADESENLINKIHAIRKSAECYRITGKIDEAENYSKNAVDLAISNKIDSEIIECLNTLAFVYASKADYDKMIDISNKSIEYCKKINDDKNLSVCLSNLGFAYWHLGNNKSASDKLNDAASIQRKIGDNRGLATTLNFSAMSFLKQGMFENALSAGFESINIKTKLGDGQKIPGGLNIIGDIYREVGDLNKAISYHEKSLALAKEYRNKGAMCDNIRDLGEDYFLMNDFKKASLFYNEVFELAKSSQIKWYETRTYISLSELNLAEGNVEEAEKNIEKGLKYSYEIGAKDLIIDALWKNAALKFFENHNDESLIKLKEAIKIAEEVEHKVFLWKLHFDLSKMFNDQNKIEEFKKELEFSKKIVNDIIFNIKEEEIKKTFCNSPKVKELFKFFK